MSSKARYLDARIREHHGNVILRATLVHIKRHDPQVGMLAFWGVCEFAYNTYAKSRWQAIYPPDIELFATTAAEEILAVVGPLKMLYTRGVFPQRTLTIQLTSSILEYLDIGVFCSGRNELAMSTLRYRHSFDLAAVST